MTQAMTQAMTRPVAEGTPPDAILLGFARVLRKAGVAVTPDREATYLRAVAAREPATDGVRASG